MQAHLHLVVRGAASVTLRPALAGYPSPELPLQLLSDIDKRRGHAEPPFSMQAEHKNTLWSGLTCKLLYAQLCADWQPNLVIRCGIGEASPQVHNRIVSVAKHVK